MYKHRLLLSQAEKRKRELEDLLDCIDLALKLRDKQWFMELTDKLKKYEV